MEWHPDGPAIVSDVPHANTDRKAPISPLTYNIVAVMDSGRRITIARGLKKSSHTADLSLIPVPGKGSLHLVAGDGVRSSEMFATAIDVPLRSPTVHILAPTDTTFHFGQALSLLGCCLDMSGQPCAPEHTGWYLDGQRIASGTLLVAHEGPEPGPHRLTFAFEPGDGVKVETSVTIHIDKPDRHHQLWEALMSHATVAAESTQKH